MAKIQTNVTMMMLMVMIFDPMVVNSQVIQLVAGGVYAAAALLGPQGLGAGSSALVGGGVGAVIGGLSEVALSALPSTAAVGSGAASVCGSVGSGVGASGASGALATFATGAVKSGVGGAVGAPIGTTVGSAIGSVYATALAATGVVVAVAAVGGLGYSIWHGRKCTVMVHNASPHELERAHDYVPAGGGEVVSPARIAPGQVGIVVFKGLPGGFTGAIKYTAPGTDINIMASNPWLGCNKFGVRLHESLEQTWTDICDFEADVANALYRTTTISNGRNDDQGTVRLDIF